MCHSVFPDSQFHAFCLNFVPCFYSSAVLDAGEMRTDTIQHFGFVSLWFYFFMDDHIFIEFLKPSMDWEYFQFVLLIM